MSAGPPSLNILIVSPTIHMNSITRLSQLVEHSSIYYILLLDLNADLRPRHFKSSSTSFHRTPIFASHILLTRTLLNSDHWSRTQEIKIKISGSLNDMKMTRLRCDFGPWTSTDDSTKEMMWGGKGSQLLWLSKTLRYGCWLYSQGQGHV